MSTRRLLWPILISFFCALFLYIGIKLYHDQFPIAFSSEQTAWGAFGDYVNMLLNVINIALLSLIGLITYQTTHSFNRLQITPLLDFSVNSPINFSPDVSDSWYLINCSNASARNIRLKFFIGNEFESRWIICYSLNGNDKLELPWMRFVSRIVVVYCDTLEENFYQLEYENLRGRPQLIRRQEYETIMNTPRPIQSIDIVSNYNNHVKLNMKEKQNNGINNGPDYIISFLKHHEFHEEFDQNDSK